MARNEMIGDMQRMKERLIKLRKSYFMHDKRIREIMNEKVELEMKIEVIKRKRVKI